MAIRSRRQTTPGSRRAPPGVERMPLAPPRVEDEEAIRRRRRARRCPTTPKPPVLRKIPVPRVVKVARTFWVLSFVLGGAAVFIAFLYTGHAHGRATEDARADSAPGYGPAEGVESLRQYRLLGERSSDLHWSSRSEAVLLAFILNRRGGARWLQLLVLALHVVVVVVALAFIAIGDWGTLVALLLLAGLALAVTGWVLCLLGSAGRWFRLKDEVQAAALD